MAAEATSTSSATFLPPALPTSREDIQAAVAKASELRALHAALLQGGANAGASYASASRSPAVIRLPPAASPALSRAGVLAAAGAEDYPVFAPVSKASNPWPFMPPCVPVLKGGSFGAGFAFSALPRNCFGKFCYCLVLYQHGIRSSFFF